MDVKSCWTCAPALSQDTCHRDEFFVQPAGLARAGRHEIDKVGGVWWKPSRKLVTRWNTSFSPHGSAQPARSPGEPHLAEPLNAGAAAVRWWSQPGPVFGALSGSHGQSRRKVHLKPVEELGFPPLWMSVCGAARAGQVRHAAGAPAPGAEAADRVRACSVGARTCRCVVFGRDVSPPGLWKAGAGRSPCCADSPRPYLGRRAAPELVAIRVEYANARAR